MKNRKYLFLLLNITGCLLFLAQPVLLPTSPPNQTLQLLSNPTIRDFIGNALIILVFYLNFYLLIPKLYFKKNHSLYFLSILLAFLTICFLPSVITGRNPFGQPAENNRDAGPRFKEHRQDQPAVRFDNNRQPPINKSVYPNFINEISHHIFLFASVIFFSLMLRIQRRLFQEESARARAELANLKAQINPHFLFNTLNSIYALAVKKDDQTAEAIINLSGLMRYIITDAKGNTIPLQRELDYIANYIDLQKSRLGDTVSIISSIGIDNQQHSIVPLILISFIENAFKYGVNPDAESVVTIDIQLENDILHLMVHNYKVIASQSILSSGIGIDNTQERLNLLYPGKHQLNIEQDENSYCVNLKMNLL